MSNSFREEINFWDEDLAALMGEPETDERLSGQAVGHEINSQRERIKYELAFVSQKNELPVDTDPEIQRGEITTHFEQPFLSVDAMDEAQKLRLQFILKNEAKKKAKHGQPVIFKSAQEAPNEKLGLMQKLKKLEGKIIRRAKFIIAYAFDYCFSTVSAILDPLRKLVSKKVPEMLHPEQALEEFMLSHVDETEVFEKVLAIEKKISKKPKLEYLLNKKKEIEQKLAA